MVACRVDIECIKSDCRILDPGRVTKERIRARGRVEATCCIIIQRVKTSGCVTASGGETEERISALSSVEIGIAAVRRRVDRLCTGRRPNPCEDEHHQEKTAPQK